MDRKALLKGILDNTIDMIIRQIRWTLNKKMEFDMAKMELSDLKVLMAL
jgi:hypothetical protein